MSTWTRWNCNGFSQICEAVSATLNCCQRVCGVQRHFFFFLILCDLHFPYISYIWGAVDIWRTFPRPLALLNTTCELFFIPSIFSVFSCTFIWQTDVKVKHLRAYVTPGHTFHRDTSPHTHTLMSQVVKLCLCLNLSLSQAFTKLLWFYWVSSKSFFFFLFFFHTQNTLNDLTVLTCQKCNCKMCGEIYMSWFTPWRCAYFLSSTLFSSLGASVPEQSQSVFTLVSLYDLFFFPSVSLETVLWHWVTFGPKWASCCGYHGFNLRWSGFIKLSTWSLRDSVAYLAATTLRCARTSHSAYTCAHTFTHMVYDC